MSTGDTEILLPTIVALTIDGKTFCPFGVCGVGGCRFGLEALIKICPFINTTSSYPPPCTGGAAYSRSVSTPVAGSIRVTAGLESSFLMQQILPSDGLNFIPSLLPTT